MCFNTCLLQVVAFVVVCLRTFGSLMHMEFDLGDGQRFRMGASGFALDLFWMARWCTRIHRVNESSEDVSTSLG